MLAFSAHVAGLVFGSLAVASAAFAIGTGLGHPPAWLPGLLALVLAGASARLPGLRFRGSPWRVPSSWGRIGKVPYAALFGATLGTGLLNALSSPAYFVLLAWAVLVATTWPPVLLVFAVFALARALPTVVMAAAAGHDGESALNALRVFQSVARYLFIIETIILAALAITWL